MDKQMYSRKKPMQRIPVMWLMLFLLLWLPIAVFAENGTNPVTEISVANRPIKGIIRIEKTGSIQTGINNDGSAINDEGFLCGAVFEIHAAEAIKGKDGKQWYQKGELAVTVTTGDDGVAQSPPLPLGTYEVYEATAPDGYVLSNLHSTVTLTAVDQETPVVVETVSFVNDPNEIKLIKTDTSGNALQGVSFGLMNADGKAIAVGTSDSNGLVRFNRIPCGTYTIREIGTLPGFCAMKDIIVTVENGVSPKPILCVNIPNHFTFQKIDSSGVGLAGVKFELTDKDGSILRKLKSDRDGMVRITDLTPGDYYLRETETLTGYTLSGDARKIAIDEKYTIPKKIPKWINYTTIQTGVRTTVTIVMWIGIGLMMLGSAMVISKKQQKKKVINSAGRT